MPQPRYLTAVFEVDDDNLPEQVEELSAILREAADQCELTLRVESLTYDAPAILHAFGLAPAALEEIPY